jgi:hypothetical protein
MQSMRLFRRVSHFVRSHMYWRVKPSRHPRRIADMCPVVIDDKATRDTHIISVRHTSLRTYIHFTVDLVA